MDLPIGNPTGSSSSCAVVDGKVYVGSNDHNLYALNALSGAKIWSFQTGGEVVSSPAVADGIVYFGSRDHKVYAVNAMNGNEIWAFDVGIPVWSSPAVANGVVYICSADSTLFALDASTGDLKWSQTTDLNYDQNIHLWMNPAVANGVVYLGSGNNNVYAFDAQSGNLIWIYQTGGKINSSPTVVDGVVYIGSYDNNVYALDASTGALKWNYPTGNGIWSTPAVADNTVYVSSMDHYLYALDKSTGQMKWRHQIVPNVGEFNGAGLASSSCAVANGVVYVGSFDGTIHALDATNGNEVWSLGLGGIVWASPAVARGIVYISTFSYGRDSDPVPALYAFGSLQQPSLPIVQSCDSSGTQKDTFNINEPVIAKASNLPASTYPLYLVQDVVTWGEGNVIPARVAGSIESITSDSTGTLNPTAIWTTPMPGQYDIIIDVNNNGKFDANIDALDNNDIVTTAGLFVVPEYALGGLLALAACFMGFIAFKKRGSIPSFKRQ